MVRLVLRAVAIGAVLLTLLAAPAVAQKADDPSLDVRKLADLASKGMYARADRWRCAPTVRYACSKDGCKKGPLTVWINIDFSAKTYERCDNKGCDKFSMVFKKGGIFTTVNSGRSAFVKAFNDGSEYVDVATLLTATVIGFGRCTPRGKK